MAADTQQTFEINAVTSFLDAYKVASRMDAAVGLERIREQSYSLAQAKAIPFDSTRGDSPDADQVATCTRVKAIFTDLLTSAQPSDLAPIREIYKECQALRALLGI